MSIQKNMHTDKALLVYANGMKASKSDKAKLLPFLAPGSVVEIGCGNGTVLALLCEHPEVTKIFGVDMSAQLLKVAGEELDGIDVELLRASIDISQIPSSIDLILNTIYNRLPSEELLGRRIDNVIFCSVLHEISSEAYDMNLKERIRAPHTVLFQTAGHITKGGRIIIRDGLRPPLEMLCLKFKTEEVRSKFFRFADDFPFDFDFLFICNDLNSVLIRSDHAFEFLTKYIYDTNWDIEVKEYFGWTNEEEIQRMELPNMKLVGFEKYTIPYLEGRWEEDFEVLDSNGDPYQLNTTFIAVYEKMT